jgi:hypothetical protein
MTSRGDDLIMEAAVGLAQGHSRRRFLGSLGLGVGALAVGRLLEHPPEAEASARCGITGCWDDDAVDVCYRPWRALRNTGVRVGPSSSAPSVGTLEGGKTFGRQSTRNPGCLTQPPLRDPSGGYAWGYIHTGTNIGTSGWVNLADIVDNPSFEGTTCGPQSDFDCRPSRGPSACGGHCDNAADPSASTVSGRRTVTATRTFRYAPGSTPYRYLVAGDVVDRLCSVSSGWTCVQVVSGRWAPAGGRGWLLSNSLQ